MFRIFVLYTLNISVHNWLPFKQANQIKHFIEAALTSTTAKSCLQGVAVTGAIGLLYLIHKKLRRHHIPRNLFTHEEKQAFTQTFRDWQQACQDHLPVFTTPSANPYITILSRETMENTVQVFTNLMKTTFAHGEKWVNENRERGSSLSTLISNEQQVPFLPFAQKIVFDDSSIAIFRSDIHGDIHSLNLFLQQHIDDNFKIKDPRIKLVFLGDYVDEGWYGAEVLYTLMRLKATNPEQVFLARGNHEDKIKNEHGVFTRELRNKFPNMNLDQVYRTYDFMPCALYLGAQAEDEATDYILGSHAYIEMGFNTQPLLDDKTKHYSFIEESTERERYIPETLSQPTKRKLQQMCHCSQRNINQLWFCMGDIIEKPDTEDPQKITKSGGYSAAFGQEITKALLQAQSTRVSRVRMLIRGHQHIPWAHSSFKRIWEFLFKRESSLFKLLRAPTARAEDPGIVRLWLPDDCKERIKGQVWDGEVVSLWSSPHTRYSTFKSLFQPVKGP